MALRLDGLSVTKPKGLNAGASSVSLFLLLPSLFEAFATIVVVAADPLLIAHVFLWIFVFDLEA